jgi:enoyl-CoA hydratase
MDRPDALNAISTGFARELLATATSLADDPEVWVAILRSSSERAFSVGADLKERRELGIEAWRRQRVLFSQTFRALRELPMPAIAQVSGFCLGGGLELALQCDFIYASETAELGLPEARVGLIPGGGGTQLLPRLIGRARAKEMIYSGARVSAAEAYRMGIVNRVVPSGEIEAAVEAVAHQIEQSSPVSVRQVKRAMDGGLDVDLTTGLAFESEAYWSAFHSDDRRV